ncbi:prephenate and/or arogenate dehydrogenase (unknown specificity) [hydrocarbon metagenome]|uniref:Prephenate/arogenate dehydrogenase domain-containing protein n=1 Tax=hydrocarbon metagenome TaxID=938273 RepID=A0A0W8G9M7_9ZZZZ
MTISSIAIVGARGGMGRLFVSKCRAAGLDVRELDRPLTPERVAAAVTGADMVLVSVPVTATGEVAQSVAPAMKPGAILADVGSVKVLPVQDMLSAYTGPVVGTHPLFGPNPAAGEKTGADGTAEALRVAVMPGCPGRDEAAATAVEGLMDRLGFAAFRTDPHEHDRAMAFVQGLNFVTTVAYLAAQQNAGDIEKFITPSFLRRLEAAKKLILEDAGLFGLLFEANPHSQEAVRTYRNFLNVAAGGDVDLLAERASAWWNTEPSRKDAS